MSLANNILHRKVLFLKKWGLRDQPPFRGVPGDVNELMRVFVNREKEMNRAILALDEGENILVRGMMGIGKTAFIMATLFEMEHQKEQLGHSILPIHVRQFAGGTREDFYRAILYALAKQLAPQNKRARNLLNALTGEHVTKGKSSGVSGGIEVQIPPILAVKTEGEIGGQESKALGISHPEHFVDELLATASKKNHKIVLAIDDMERVSNQGTIKTMLESSLDLLRDNRCSFILTGRTLTIMEDVYASGLDIFNEAIPLRPLSGDELSLIAVKTLNLVRIYPSDTNPAPFTDESLEAIAEKSFGIPRQFILLCGRILRIALENGVEELNAATFDECFIQLQEEVADKEVPPDIRRVLYLGLQQGGFSVSKDADLDQVFDILGITTLTQFVEFANGLVHQDLLARVTDQRGEILYRLAPGIERLAEAGATPDPSG